MFDQVHSPREWRSNDITYLCKAPIPDNIFFLRYELLFDLTITKTSKCCNFQPIDATELSQGSIDRKFPADSKNAIILQAIFNRSGVMDSFVHDTLCREYYSQPLVEQWLEILVSQLVSPSVSAVRENRSMDFLLTWHEVRYR